MKTTLKHRPLFGHATRTLKGAYGNFWEYAASRMRGETIFLKRSRLSIEIPFFLQVSITIFLLFALNTSALAINASLSWDANTESDLSGYKIYFGMASGSYGNPVDVGNTTSHTFSDLADGTYYFTVTALDTSGNESLFSNEVSKTFSSTSNNDIAASGGGGGCGIIRRLGGGEPPKPGDAAAMLTLVGFLGLMLLKKTLLRRTPREVRIKLNTP